MNEETKFLFEIGSLVIQIVILFGFYFAALRRLFIPPTPSNLLVLVIVLIGIPGFLLVFAWGWIRHQRMKITRLMMAWTMALAIAVFEFTIISSIENTAPSWVLISIAVVCTISIGWMMFQYLIPFLRADDRMRTVMRESSPKRIQRLAILGEQAIPSIQLMLEDDYLQFRLDAIECLALMGAVGIPMLEKTAKDSDRQVATAASAALDATKAR